MAGSDNVRFRATMYFSYGRRKRPEVTASTTFEAILRGERTSTTRFDSWRGSDKWRDARPGDVAEFYEGKDMSGRSLQVRVMDVRRIALATCAEDELEAWSRAEGWLPEEGRKLGRHHGEATWVLYELTSTPTDMGSRDNWDSGAAQLSLGL